MTNPFSVTIFASPAAPVNEEIEFSHDVLLFVAFVQSYMDSEIRAIMAQYMPLDSQNEVNNHMQEDIW